MPTWPWWRNQAGRTSRNAPPCRARWLGRPHRSVHQIAPWPWLAPTLPVASWAYATSTDLTSFGWSVPARSRPGLSHDGHHVPARAGGLRAPRGFTRRGAQGGLSRRGHPALHFRAEAPAAKPSSATSDASKRRHRIEMMSGRLKDWRRAAVRLRTNARWCSSRPSPRRNGYVRAMAPESDDGRTFSRALSIMDMT